jgi:hypothetical protein
LAITSYFSTREQRKKLTGGTKKEKPVLATANMRRIGKEFRETTIPRYFAIFPDADSRGGHSAGKTRAANFARWAEIAR